jgi:hypothetical protein
VSRCADDILDFKLGGYGPLYSFLDNDHVQKMLIEMVIEVKLDSDSNKFNLFFKRIEQFFESLQIKTYLCYFKICFMKISALYDFGSFKLFPNDKNFLRNQITPPDAEHVKFFGDLLKDPEVYATILEVKEYAIDSTHAGKNALHSATDFLNSLKVIGAKALFIEGHYDGEQYHDIYIVNKDDQHLSRTSGLEKVYTDDNIFDMDAFVSANPKIFMKLQKVFDGDKASVFERKIKNSLVWYGESLYEPNFSHKLLKMIIAIESLLLDGEDRGTKSYLLEERAAFLLSDTQEVRCLFAETMEEAYRVRNKIVHSGEKQPVPLRLIKYLMLIVHQLIIKILLDDKVVNLKDLKTMVRERKYS